jgi:hypothetical protein
MRILRCLPLVLVPLLAACGPPPPPAQPVAEATVQTPPPATAAPEAESAPPPASTAAPARPKPAASSGQGPQIKSIPGTSIRFEGGSGRSENDAIVVRGAKGEKDGVASEYQFLSLVYGQQGTAWKLEKQALLEHDGRNIDEMDVVTASGEKVVYYFDISDFFGKF